MHAQSRSMIRGLLFTLAVISLHASAKTEADTKFESITHQYFEQYLASHPETATQLGDHRFDTRTSDYSAKGVEADRQLYHKTLKALAALPANALSVDDEVDRRILENQLKLNLFTIEVLKTQNWRAIDYAPAEAIYLLVARDFAPLTTRLQAVKARLLDIPKVVSAAKANLKRPPKVFTETAIQQNQGAISLIKNDLDEFVKQAPEMKAELAPARKQAIAALESYGKWLNDVLLPRSTGNFRLGAANFEQQLRYTLDSDLTAASILQQAESELKKTHAEMLETALPLYKAYFPEKSTEGMDGHAIVRAVLDKIADTHANNDTIVDEGKKSLAAATQFVRDHKLLSLPTAPVDVIEMPEFARGVSVAFCDSAGPLEKNGKTFYAISPTPKDWSEKRALSYFREYNYAMLNDLTVHEAMPGHYVQLMTANTHQYPTLVRGIYNSGSYVEGWATYAEQVMAKAGFGGPETHLEQLKMRLRLIINAMLDQKIHAGNMTEKEAMDLMMHEGYQEEGEAAGKWRRAELSAGQLSTYFVGNLEINALSRDLQAKTGGDLQSVHDEMLAHGSIATKYVRQLIGLQPMAN